MHQMIPFLVLAIWLFLPSLAYAYLDPATGSMILQGVIAALAGGVATVAFYWRQVVRFFRGKGRGAKASKAKSDTPRDD
jgi:uncharacterized membrane protein